MAIRVSTDDVRSIIEHDTSISMDPFIVMGNALTEKVDAQDADSDLTDDLLFAIEQNLSAHFYETRDSQLSQEKSGDASGVYQGQTAMGLSSSKWGQNAMILDITGYLSKLNQQMLNGKQTATSLWMGREPSNQTDYLDRD